MRADDLLFVSDLHLDAALPAAVAQFSAFLQGPARQAQGLYILGDLFESWIGDDDDEPTRSAVCDALRTYTQAGHRLWLMRGNRDFLYGPAFEARTGATLLPDPLRIDFAGQSWLACHGDVLCTDDHAYQELRSIVRVPAWQARFNALPLPTRRELADALRAGSRAHTGRVRYEVMDVNAAAVEAALRSTGLRRMIHGHTHRPAVHNLEVDGEAALRIVLGDWYEQGSCLRLSADGQFELMTLPR